jgi:hypothetical protein
MNKKLTSPIAVTIAAICLGGVAFSQIKIAGPTSIRSQPTAATAESVQATPSPATMSAKKKKIWNSPTMLHARAWVQEYCQRSAKITPVEARQYMEELEKLTPAQMKLWLLRFDAEQEHIRAQQAAFDQHRQAKVKQAISVEKQTRKEYADINRGENEAAGQEEKSLAKEKQFSNQMMEQNASERTQAADTMLNPYGAFGYGGHSGYGGYHVHYHIHH